MDFFLSLFSFIVFSKLKEITSVRKALQTSGFNQIFLFLHEKYNICLSEFLEIILSECAEYELCGKMIEKHWKSVIFHHELFMACYSSLRQETHMYEVI